MLKLVMGPMFSGKTTELIQTFKKYSYINKTVVVLNYIEDTRYHSSLLSTHDKQMIPCILTKTLSEMWTNLHDVDVILINEGQFFTDLFEVVIDMVEAGKIVYVYGLDGDSTRAPFGQILHLIPYADDYIKLKALCAVCKDGTPAIFSHRISDESEQIVIGSDNYMPLCRKCFA